jgi:omega-amidase
VTAPAAPPLRVALGEYDTGWHDAATSLARAGELVARAASAGARLVVLPETCTTGFTMDAERFAEPADGPAARALAALARAHGVWILAGLALRGEGDARPSNAAMVLDPSGAAVALYRKQRLFAYAGEHRHYSAGDAPAVVTVEGVRVAPFICYDLRFPELFRRVAADVDLLVVIANWPAERRAHWDALVRARAIENLCYVAAVNRTGEGGTLRYDGGSVAYGPWGELEACAAAAGDVPATVDVDPAEVARVRVAYPFLDDR